MTRVVTIWLECDHCRAAQRQGKPGQTIDELREALASVGWLSDKATDSDACPSCVGQAVESRHG